MGRRCPVTHLRNLTISGNRFLNEADNISYQYGIVVGSRVDNAYIDADNVYYKIKAQNIHHV